MLATTNVRQEKYQQQGEAIKMILIFSQEGLEWKGLLGLDLQ